MLAWHYPRRSHTARLMVPVDGGASALSPSVVRTEPRSQHEPQVPESSVLFLSFFFPFFIFGYGVLR